MMAEIRNCPKCGGELPEDAPAGICPRCLMAAGLPQPDSPALAATATESLPSEPVPPEAIAGYFPQLQILSILGQGGMGTVYKARQVRLDRMVALKTIRPDVAQDAAFAERFHREARTLARLSHANIVGVHDFGEVETDDGVLYYFVMEYVDGPNLRLLQQSADLHPAQALAIIPQICDALQFAHSEGVVHRDIKPENILIDLKGRVKIADFGLAKLAARSAQEWTLTGTHQIMGTPRYMAPEQMVGSRTVDHRADLYSLGVVFYELLTGELPMGQFEPPSVKVGADARLDEVVLRALAREPERRYQSASEFKSCVEAISSVEAAPGSGASRAPGPHDRAGASTIIEREAVAAWQWLAADPHPGHAAHQPPPPTLLMLLLSLAGCLCVLLPWIEVEILPTAKRIGSISNAVVTADHGAGAYQLCLWQEGAGIGSSDEELSGAFVEQTWHVFSGLEKWPGIVASVCFALMALALIAIPPSACRKVRWLLPLTFLAVLALIHTFLFRGEVDVTLFRPVSELPAENPQITQLDLSREAGAYVLCQSAAPRASDGSRPLHTLPHRLTYRSGYYSSLSLAVVMIVLTATGIRHALTNAETVDRSGAKSNGQPLARYRFNVPTMPDLSSHIQFHLAGLGYELQQETETTWVFYRGRPLAGFAATDIRAYATTLTVRTNQLSGGETAFSCLWEVRSLGALIFSADTRKLEDEGRELESLLHELQPGNSVTSTVSADGPDRSPGLRPSAVGTDSVSSDVSNLNRADASIQAAKDEVEGAAIALMVIGALALVGHIGYLIYQASSGRSENGWLLLAIVPAIFMIKGGKSLLSLRSRDSAVWGATSGLVLFSPAWPLSAFAGAFAWNLLGRPHVRRGFQAARRQTALGSGDGPRFSQKAIVGACLIPLSLLMLSGLFVTTTVVTGPSSMESHGSTMVTSSTVVLMVGVVLVLPCAITALGMMAVHDVTGSNGKIHGLGLAFTDLVFFPALLLNTIAGGICYFVIAGLHVPTEAFYALSLITVLVLLLVTSATLRMLWKRTVATAQPPPTDAG